MKKILYSAMIAMLALGVGSCSNEIVENEIKPTDAMRTLTVRLVESEATRATFNDVGNGLIWEDGDQIAYFVDGGTCQIAPIVNGTFTVDLNTDRHTIEVAYPVGGYTAGATHNIDTENVPIVQSQAELDKFNGANLPLTGTAEVDAGTEDCVINANYDVNNAAILAFTVTTEEGNTTYDTEALSLLYVSTNTGTYAVALPTDKTIADLKGKTVYAVIPSRTYTDIKVSLATSAAYYNCSTNISQHSKINGTVANSKCYNATLRIDKAESVTRTAGLKVKLGEGSWQAWNGSWATLQVMDNGAVKSGATVGSTTTPYSIKVATEGTTTFTKGNMTALVDAIKALNDASIALDMSAVKMAASATENKQPLYQAFMSCTQLQSFVFPTDGTNITSLHETFSGCSNLTSVSAIPSGVTVMAYTFNGCTKFNQAIIIPNGVTTLTYTFGSCTKFDKAIEIPSSVTNMTRTFSSCSSFNSSVTFASGSQVTNMSNTFMYCYAFNKEINIPSSVTNMSNTFNYCIALGKDSAKTVTINIASGEISTTTGDGKINISNMFDNCTTGNIDLRVTDGYCPNAASKLWYSSTIGNWTFNSVTAI